jgi:hypothetical protein
MPQVRDWIAAGGFKHLARQFFNAFGPFDTRLAGGKQGPASAEHREFTPDPHHS